jgi:hypothetical protein
VRIDKMPNDRLGVAVELLMTVNYSGSGPGSPVRS